MDGRNRGNKTRYVGIVIAAVSVQICFLVILSGVIWYLLKQQSMDIFNPDMTGKEQTEEISLPPEIDWEDAETYLECVEYYLNRGELEEALEYAQRGFGITKDDRLKEKADSIESGGNVYNSYGQAVRITGYDENKNIIWWHVFSYDSEKMYSDPISVTAYDKNGRETGTVALTYDSKELRDIDSYYLLDDETGEIGLVRHDYPNKYTDKSEWYKDAEGKELDYYNIFEFDRKGRLKRDEWYNEEDMLYEYGVPEYNEEGVLVKKDWYYREHADEDFILLYYTIKEYDVEGRLVKEENYDTDGELLWYNITEYDGERETRYASYDGNGVLEWYDTYENGGEGLGINHYGGDGHLIYSE